MKNIIEFMELISLLKELQRTGWKVHNVSGVLDTTASHTLGVIFLAWLFAKKTRADVEKLMKMALVHDLVESEIGDLSPQDTQLIDRDKLEEDGLKTLTRRIPAELQEEIVNLIKEFRAERSRESKLVRACDKLDTVFQAYFYRKADRLSEASFNEFFDFAETACRKGLARELLDQIRDAARKQKFEQDCERGA
jgi:putative hydrolase of HD superfamily